MNTREPWGHLRLRDTIRLWFSRCVGGYCNGIDAIARNKPLFLASYLLTPYFHCLLCHVPQMIKFKEIYSFTGQNFEKDNHVHQRIHNAASNHHSDNRPVLMQTLRVLMNKVGAAASRIASTPCDSPTCSMEFVKQGNWITHRKRDHPDEVKDEDDVSAAVAFKRMRAQARDSLPDPNTIMDKSFVRDVNNAYDAILANQRLTDNERYKGGRNESLKRNRDIEKLIKDLADKGFNVGI